MHNLKTDGCIECEEVKIKSTELRRKADSWVIQIAALNGVRPALVAVMLHMHPRQLEAYAHELGFDIVFTPRELEGVCNGVVNLPAL